MTDTLIKIGAKTYKASEYDLPTDRVFRDAWKANNTTGVIEVDMAKARAIWRAKIRAARASVMAALDVEYMKAIEQGRTESMAAIAAKKQALRDATSDPAIDAAQTPEELKAVQPAGLKVE